jgi:hypothetical protein
MAEEKKSMNTKALIAVVFGFFALGMIAILDSREADHQSYSENASNAQEAMMTERAKSFDNVFVE